MKNAVMQRGTTNETGETAAAEFLEFGRERGYGAHDEEGNRKTEKRSQRHGSGKHFAQGASRHALLKVAFGLSPEEGRPREEAGPR